jgi:hypothetical protein
VVSADSQRPHWKEKFINGLPLLFAHKVKDELINSTTSLIEYENLTCVDLFSTVKKLCKNMCIDEKNDKETIKKC